MLFLAAAEQPANPFLQMTEFLDVFLLITLFGCAVYGLYTVIRLRKTYLLFPNKFLYPNGCSPETCIDEGGFIDFILPRLTIMSVALLIMGIAYALRLYVFGHVQHWSIEIATIILPCATLLWYGLVQRKSSQLFW